MQFMTALFSGPNSVYLNAAFALGIVLVLIVLAVWVLKLFANAGGDFARVGGGKRRLTVVDQVVVDNKRRLLIVRRDNVEHLIMTGGPQDLLVESGIPVEEKPASASVRRNVRPTPPPKVEPEAEIATPPAPAHTVSRDTVDRLRDLARPAPLRANPPLRRTGLLRPVSNGTTGVFPMTPSALGENPGVAALDSAKTGANGGGGSRLGGARYRFIRSITRSDQP